MLQWQRTNSAVGDKEGLVSSSTGIDVVQSPLKAPLRTFLLCKLHLNSALVYFDEANVGVGITFKTFSCISAPVVPAISM